MNNTLANGLALLQFLSRTADSFGVSELATALSLPKSHVHRLLRTLVEGGYAVQDSDRRYRVGLRPLEVSSAVLHHLPLRAAALPRLHRLAEITGLDAIATIPHDGVGLTVAAVFPAGRQRDPGAAIGSRLAPGGTATGKVFATLIDGFADRATVPPRELPSIRRARFAVKDASLAAPMNGMAAAVVDERGAVLGGLGLAGPGDDFRRGFERASALLREHADELGAELSARPAMSAPH